MATAPSLALQFRIRNFTRTTDEAQELIDLLTALAIRGNPYAFHPAETSGGEAARRTRRVNQNAFFQFNFFAPPDYDLDRLVRNELWGYAVQAGSAAASIGLSSQYGNPLAGEQLDHHTASDNTQTYDLSVAERLVRIDVSSVFPLLAAGDHAGIRVAHGTINTPVDYLGHYLEWAPP